MDILLQVAEGDEVFRYATVAATSLVCYEFLITLDNEIRFVWNRRISFGGALLLLCRYLPFGSFVQAYVYMVKDNLDTTTCIAGVRASACFLLIEFLLSALVLYTRAYAVWEGSRRILYLLVLTYAGVLVAGAYSVYMFLRGIQSLLVIWPNGCVPLPVNDDLWIALAILIVSESLSLGLLLIKSVKHAHALKDFGIFHGNSKHRLISVMSHDGIGYFVCTLAITITNLMILRHVNFALRNFLFLIQGSIEVILCSRLLFHIRLVGGATGNTYAGPVMRPGPHFTSTFDESENSMDNRHIDIASLELATRK